MNDRKKMTVEYFDQLLNATPGKLLEVIGTQPDDRPQDVSELTLLVVNLLTRQHRLDVRQDVLNGHQEETHRQLVGRLERIDLADERAEAFEDGLEARLVQLAKDVSLVNIAQGDKLKRHEKLITLQQKRIDELTASNIRTIPKLAKLEARVESLDKKNLGLFEVLASQVVDGSKVSAMQMTAIKGLAQRCDDQAASLDDLGHGVSYQAARTDSVGNSLVNTQRRCEALEATLIAEGIGI